MNPEDLEGLRNPNRLHDVPRSRVPPKPYVRRRALAQTKLKLRSLKQGPKRQTLSIFPTTVWRQEFDGLDERAGGGTILLGRSKNRRLPSAELAAGRDGRVDRWLRMTLSRVSKASELGRAGGFRIVEARPEGSKLFLM